jgi:hypothetical protein
MPGVGVGPPGAAIDEWDAPHELSDIPGLEMRLKLTQMERAAVRRDVQLAREREAFLSLLLNRADGDRACQKGDPVPGAITDLTEAYRQATKKYRDLMIVLEKEIARLGRMARGFASNPSKFSDLGAHLDGQINALGHSRLKQLSSQMDDLMKRLGQDRDGQVTLARLTQALESQYNGDLNEVERRQREPWPPLPGRTTEGSCRH